MTIISIVRRITRNRLSERWMLRHRGEAQARSSNANHLTELASSPNRTSAVSQEPNSDNNDVSVYFVNNYSGRIGSESAGGGGGGSGGGSSSTSNVADGQEQQHQQQEQEAQE